jgi:tRNA nucleotidyltransferase/poly(A) polymerase
MLDMRITHSEKMGEYNRQPSSRECGVREELKGRSARRDFTINAMAYSDATGVRGLLRRN